MNTRADGDAFEQQIHDLLKGEIEAGRFLVPSSRCRFHLKRGYYSKDREKDIIFDIAIEVFIPGQENPSLLIVVECKNYSHPVPVNDAEEFFAKLQQISGAKGMSPSAVELEAADPVGVSVYAATTAASTRSR